MVRGVPSAGIAGVNGIVNAQNLAMVHPAAMVGA